MIVVSGLHCSVKYGRYIPKFQQSLLYPKEAYPELFWIKEMQLNYSIIHIRLWVRQYKLQGYDVLDVAVKTRLQHCNLLNGSSIGTMNNWEFSHKYNLLDFSHIK